MNSIKSQTIKSKTGDLIIIENLENTPKFIVNNNQNMTLLLLLVDNNNEYDGEIDVMIRGENAKVKIFGIIIGSGTQKIKLHTIQDH